MNDTAYGPLFITGMQWTSPDITNGIAYSTLVFRGGQTMHSFYESLYTTADAMLIEYWRQLRLNLNGDNSCIVIINGGLNDRNESEPSPINAYSGDSPEAYKERVELIIDRLIGTWTAIDEIVGRGDQDALTIIVMPSHPISTPDDSELVSYRVVAKEIIHDYPNVGFVMIPDLVPQAEFVTGGYYQNSGSDTAHLERIGYRTVAQAIVNSLK